MVKNRLKRRIPCKTPLSNVEYRASNVEYRAKPDFRTPETLDIRVFARSRFYLEYT